MALLADYTAGTINVSANGTAVTGTGTAWQTAGFKEGDWLIANGWVNVIASVNSNTSLTLAQPWRGGALSGAAYRLRYMSDGSRASAQARQLIDLLGGSGNLEALAGLVGEPGKIPVFTGAGTMGLLTRQDITQGVRYDVQIDTLAERSAYDAEAEGFAVLVSDTGDGRSAIYSREGGVGNWSAPAYITGPSITLDVTEVDEVPYGTPPDVELTPIAGGYNLAFEIPRGMIIEPGTTTTLGPGDDATVDFVPITGGYRLDIGLPKGDTGDIDGVTPFWVTRLSSDADAAAARTGLGATATGAALFTAADAAAARDAVGANDASNLTTGTLPDDRVSATLTPDKAFRRGNVLGTVSESGGVPTGAIIERGSNANGEYIRFADGTQICTAVKMNLASLSSRWRDTWNFPAGFSEIGQRAMVVTPDLFDSGVTINERKFIGASTIRNNEGSSGLVDIYLLDGAPIDPTTTSMNAFCLAVGRWF